MACMTLKRSYEFDPVLSPQHQPSPKRRRCTPLVPSSSSSSAHTNSPFYEVTPRLSQEQLSTNIHLEWKRLQRRKRVTSGSNNTDTTETSQTPVSMFSPLPLASSMPGSYASSPSASPPRKEQALFTLKQVSLICERMLKERDEEVREQYDKVLNQKLSEQYDAFVKFNYDQVQRRFENTAPTYVS